MPIKSIGEIAKENNIYYLVDAAQSAESQYRCSKDEYRYITFRHKDY